MYETFQPWHFMRPNLGELTSRSAALPRQGAGALHQLAVGRHRRARPAAASRSATTLRKMAEATSAPVADGPLRSARARAATCAARWRAPASATTSPPPSRKPARRCISPRPISTAARSSSSATTSPTARCRISTAIAASCALPLWYRPMLVDNPRARRAGRARPARPRRRRASCAPPTCASPSRRAAIWSSATTRSRASATIAPAAACTITACRRSRRSRCARMIGARLDLAKEVVFLDPNVKADVVFIEPAEDDYAFFNMGALNFWAKDRADPPRLRGGAPVDRRLARAARRGLRQSRHRAAHAAGQAAADGGHRTSICASHAARAPSGADGHAALC